MFTKSKKLQISLIILLLICIIGLTIKVATSSTEKEKTVSLPVRPVKTQLLSKGPGGETRSFPGIVNADIEAKLSFRVGGPLTILEVKVGQWVEKDDVIAQIDPRDFIVQVNKLKASLLEAKANLAVMKNGARKEDLIQLEARLKSARAAYEEAAMNLARYRTLVENGAVSRATYDSARAANDMHKAIVVDAEQALEKAKKGSRKEDIDAMEARLLSLESDLAAAKNALEDTSLKAPFSGFINEKNVENHETVQPGQVVLTLLDTETLKIHSAIPESMFVRKDEIVSANCTFEAWPGRSYKAMVDSIGRKTSTANQSYPMSLMIQRPSEITVTPGMAATITLELKKTGNSRLYSLPSTSVFSDPAGISNIWIVDQTAMTVHRHPIQISSVKADKIFFTSDLPIDSRIVTAGAKFLREGQKVKLLAGSTRG